ncbi:MAG: di-heme oxidoredictase family protein [Anderseniella sp.]|jgi:CxxC motif-containing protein (DUF1111 family)|nr:di-heme oxidoredictase family protein [Anderseniella sp.]
MRLLTAVIAVAAAGWTVPAGASDEAAMDLLRQNWTSAETSSDGLGPLYNEASCHACHWFGGGARIRVRPGGEVAAAGMLVRLTDAAGRGDPHYGFQLQNKAVAGVEPEGVASLQSSTVLDDLTQFVVVLRRRQAEPLSAGHVPSLRAAPALDAAGLIEMIPDEAILTRHDPDDADGDGISGRAHMVRLPDGSEAVGRFNWKATQTSIAAQVAAAFHVDMGLSTSLISARAGDCTASQTDCLNAAAGSGDADVSDQQIESLTGLVRSFSSSIDEAALPSPAAFQKAGCASCHVPRLDDGPVSSVPLYSDLLLHDMGPGLSSHGGEGDASPQEWRTTPLVGWRGHIAGHRFLHDGRAATIDEAIRWHGGEAQLARDAYLAMSALERLQLASFVQALLTAMPVPAGLPLEE